MLRRIFHLLLVLGLVTGTLWVANQTKRCWITSTRKGPLRSS
jgi:hypothetical protein